MYEPPSFKLGHVIFVTVVAILLAVVFVRVVTEAIQPAQASPTESNCIDAECSNHHGKDAFDHSNCQYPTRWTNPANGCDNTDPAVPECIGQWETEAQEKQCIDDFVKSRTEPAKPTPKSEPTNNCGGK